MTGVRLAAVVCALLGLAACTATHPAVGRSAHSTVSAAGASVARPQVSPPPAGGVFDYQIGGPYRPATDVRIVDRDRSSEPVPGRYSICYVNAFQTQPDEAHFWTSRHPALLLRVGGRYVHDPDWPGEYILDTSTAAKRAALVTIVGRWFDDCAARGFDAVEPDNLDSWTRHGVHGAITRADDLALARLLVRRGHAHGLAVAQKNTAEVAPTGHARIGFDFAIAEECQVYAECGRYVAGYGRHVLEIEYTDNPRSAYRAACAARAGRISIILRDRDVVPRGRPAYRYEHC